MKYISWTLATVGAVVIVSVAFSHPLSPAKDEVPGNVPKHQATLNACEAPKREMSKWKRVPVANGGLTLLLLLPPSFELNKLQPRYRHGGTQWKSGSRTFEAASGGGWGSPGTSECEVQVDGAAASLMTTLSDGRYVVVATFKDSKDAFGRFLILTGIGDSVEDQRLFLAMIRSVKVQKK